MRAGAPWNGVHYRQRCRSRLGALVLLALVAPFASCRMGLARIDVLQCAQPPAHAAAPLVGASSVAHAHNDYEHAHPLADALAHGFRSVEADVLWRNGKIVVSHDG